MTDLLRKTVNAARRIVDRMNRGADPNGKRAGRKRARRAVVTEEEFQFLSVRQLMWRKFRRNRMALVGGVVLILMYLIVTFAGFFSPYGPRSANAQFTFAPPQRLRFHDPESGRWHLRPFVYRMTSERNLETFSMEYGEDRSVKDFVYLFERGDEYTLFGSVTADLHLFGTRSGTIYLMGTDERGRDVLSRILFGGRISMTVGLLGVAITVVLGSVIGTLSGYYGGAFDSIMQRLIELLRSFPQLAMWMALSAAIPPTWPSVWVYVGIVVVLGFINWTQLGRELRGKVLSLKEQDYVLAAEAVGASTPRILFRHLIPNMASHIIVTATLSIPVMIIGESSLSFLGIGVKPPMVSWGLMLSQARKIQVLALYPWMLFPGLFILLAVMAYNFLGDGFRDMVDPFSK